MVSIRVALSGTGRGILITPNTTYKQVASWLNRNLITEDEAVILRKAIGLANQEVEKERLPAPSPEEMTEEINKALSFFRSERETQSTVVTTQKAPTKESAADIYWNLKYWKIASKGGQGRRK
jgi:hypothetical protein